MRKNFKLVSALLVIRGLSFLVAPPPAMASMSMDLGDLGMQMAEAGVVDIDTIGAYADINLFNSPQKSNMLVDESNASSMLNFFWALGLSNKNIILEEGPMMTVSEGKPERFASTGGWSLTKSGNVMDYYSAFDFITLDDEQQKLLEKTASGIYRPCCKNSTLFPDCNHGMAMFGMLELMISQGVDEAELKSAAVQMNDLWFPKVSKSRCSV